MITNNTLILQFQHFIPNSLSKFSFSSLHTRSLSPYKSKPNNWNTTHSFIHSNPLLSLLETCNSMAHLKQIQAQMITSGLILDPVAASRLIAFCAISDAGDLSYCVRVLKFVRNSSGFSWNVAIRGYSESENPIMGVVLYKEMLKNGGCKPNNYTYPLLFKICGRLLLNCMGYEILGHVLKLGFDVDLFVRNGLIHMLVSFGEVGVARKLFDESSVRDLVTWNTLINGYMHCGQAREALAVYEEMIREGVRPDEVTMIGMVSSCARLENFSRGRQFHLYIWDQGLELTVPLCNALMDMYVKCRDLKAAEIIFDEMSTKTMVSWTTMLMGYAKFGLLDRARKLFDEMPEKDVVPWNAMIGAYVQANRYKEALALVPEMQEKNIKPDEVTMVNCLSACSQLGALDIGMWIHWYIQREKLTMNVAVGTALVDMYAKCGNIGKALQVFQEMPLKNSLTWTVIIGGLAVHGNGHDALQYFLLMIDAGFVPDEITFLGLLSACCHGGLVDEGRKYFGQMTSEYNLLPQMKHYSCMVDLLGRAGLLDEAEALIQSMPMEADAAVWGALLSASRVHGNMMIGEKAAWKLIELDPDDSGNYVLLANMYEEAAMWGKARRVRKMMMDRRVEKTPGCSSIELDGIVNEFIVRDKSHPQYDQIYECLARLSKHMEFVGSAMRATASWAGLLV